MTKAETAGKRLKAKEKAKEGAIIERNETSDARESCAKQFLAAAPEAAKAVCTLATEEKKEWALKYVLGAIGLEEAVQQTVSEQADKKQQDAFISTAFERRLIEDLRRAGRSKGDDDAVTVED